MLKFTTLLLCCVSSAHAADRGVASIGATGGLHIPSAHVLESGEAAASFGNAQDPKLGAYDTRQNYTLGFGLGGNVELFGRLAEYTTPNNAPPGLPNFATGLRDISANVKWQLPLQTSWLPKLAVGMTDVSGGAVFFKSAYAVASDTAGPLRWSLGFARGAARGGQATGAKVLDGPFGGAELRLWGTRVTLLAETNGSSKHAGVRYTSEPLPWLGQAQFVGTLQQSFNTTSYQTTLVFPLGADAAAVRRSTATASAASPLLAESVSGSPTENMEKLRLVLQATGLDRVRVGTHGPMWVVEYENQRYLRNEVDALGLVLGLAAELAPGDIKSVRAIALKNGQAMSQTSVSPAAYRDYLRWGDTQPVLDSMAFDVLAPEDLASVQWLGGPPAPTNRLRVSLRPLLNTNVGTEFGLFDHSLALQARVSTGLWKGAVAYADVVRPVSNSANFEPGRIFSSRLHRSGLQTAALQQSFWLGPRWFSSVGAGRYGYDTTGLQAESILLMPWNDDSVHLHASTVSTKNQTSSSQPAWSTSYRWRANPKTWLEAGFHEYTDGGRGPSLLLTRWFGDVALQMVARRDADHTFVGLQISLPLTPRQGMGAAAVQVSGSPRFATGLRTKMANGGANYVIPMAVRPLELSFAAEVELLNSGRITAPYVRSQLMRMRESFYLYAPRQSP